MFRNATITLAHIMLIQMLLCVHSSMALVVPHFSRRGALYQLGQVGAASVAPLLSTTIATGPSRPIRVQYGSGKDQFGELWLPECGFEVGNSGWPVVVLLHGGFWQQDYDRRLMNELAASTICRGLACWNIEYSRVGNGGFGGKPQTFLDVAAGIDWLGSSGSSFGLDSTRVGIVGHSAGGTLALWAAMRPLLPQKLRGSQHRLVAAGQDAIFPCAAVSLGGVLDLQWAAQQHHGNDAVPMLMGSAPPWTDASSFSPIDMLPPVSESLRREAEWQGRRLKPPDCRIALVHAQRDAIVPVEHSIRYTVAACTAGIELELHRVASESHFDCLDPESLSWKIALATMQRGTTPVPTHARSLSPAISSLLRSPS